MAQTNDRSFRHRYEILKIIGRGSFGQVIRAYDHKKQQHVALKMVSAPPKSSGLWTSNFEKSLGKSF